MLVVYVKLFNLVIKNMYHPPLCPAVSFYDCMEEMECELSALGSPVQNIMVASDVNFPAVDWQNRTMTIIPWVVIEGSCRNCCTLWMVGRWNSTQIDLQDKTLF